MSTETLSRDRRIFVRWDDDTHFRIRLAALKAKITLAELIEQAVRADERVREVERLKAEQEVKAK